MTAAARKTLILVVCLMSSRVAAQDTADHQHSIPATAARTWTWTTDANVFAGFNYQRRRYIDFAAWESQNWFMAGGERRIGAGQLAVRGMLSLEPLTVGRYTYMVGGSRFRSGGSPQLFQTGESFERRPLIDVQHPHDLVTALGTTYRLPKEGVTYIVGADLVGSPTLGPTPFMHRPSSRNNPQAPLAHHHLDSTHATPGVIRAGVEVSRWTFEASVFRGEEPDEQRHDIDSPRFDSWAGRIGWQRGPWRAQFSGGLLHEPEWFEPYDQRRITASVDFSGSVGQRPLAATAVWGQTREYTPFGGVSGAYLLEWDLGVTNMLSTYGRTEVVRKEILFSPHPKGFEHPHFFSDVTATTVGVVRDVSFLGLSRMGRFGIGADMTLYRMSEDLQLLYAGSASFHAFLRWRPNAAAPQHVH